MKDVPRDGGSVPSSPAPTPQPDAPIWCYALVDPRPSFDGQDPTDERGRVRYVGKSYRLGKRFAEHIRRASDNPWRARWIAELARIGVAPILVLLEECHAENWQERERWWELYFRSQGEPLTNLAECGQGAIYSWATAEHREKCRQNLNIIRQRPEVKAKIRASLKAVWADPERRAKARAAGQHRKHTAESRALMSEGRKKAWQQQRAAGPLPECHVKTWEGFVDPATREEIPAFRNLSAFCRDRGVSLSKMREVAKGVRKSLRGWTNPAAWERIHPDDILA